MYIRIVEVAGHLVALGDEPLGRPGGADPAADVQDGPHGVS